MALDTKDKAWICGTVDRVVGRAISQSLAKFKVEIHGDFDRQTGVLLEGFKHEIGLLRELMPIHPTREEVWNMIYEDGRKRQAELDIFKEELIGHRRRIEVLETAA